MTGFLLDVHAYAFSAGHNSKLYVPHTRLETEFGDALCVKQLLNQASTVCTQLLADWASASDVAVCGRLPMVMRDGMA